MASTSGSNIGTTSGGGSNMASTSCSTFQTTSNDNTEFEILSKEKDFEEVSNEPVVPYAFRETPGGSVFYRPNTCGYIQLKIGDLFNSTEEVYQKYESYAELCGFNIKRSSQNKARDGSVNLKVFRCTREGHSTNLSHDTLKSGSDKLISRKSTTHKTGCKACIRCRLLPGLIEKWEIYGFEEEHNHKLVSEKQKNFLMKRRKMDYSDMQLIQEMSRSNVGPITAHRYNVDMNGGYENVGPTSDDYKNCKRNINRYIGDSDAHMVVERLLRKQETLVNFTCEYKCDDEGCLLGLFWSDNVSKLNYKEFGDLVSFDATYGTNRYNMVFVPLTGVDNHKRCVTFGAALLSSESIESYSWFVDCFIKTFGGVEPTIVVTDQDPSMREAIKMKFKKANHRLCMWHISQKLSLKVGLTLYNAPNFKERMNRIFWSRHMTTDYFETLWAAVIKDYNLQNVRWFRDMYEIKEIWIPAFFRDLEMNGLMRTSSLSESENAFFKKCKNKQSTLVDFFFRFEAAIDKQRFNQRGLEYEMDSKSVKFTTRSKIERVAHNLYTPTVFKLVQKEMEEGYDSCTQLNYVEEEEIQTCYIQEKVAVTKKKLKFKVVYNAKNAVGECSCMLYRRNGILCRHVFAVYKIHDIENIPSEHIMRRWTREASECLSIPDYYATTLSEHSRIAKDLHISMRKVVARFRHDTGKLKNFKEKFMNFLKEIEPEIPAEKMSNNLDEEIELLLGVPKPAKVTIHPLQGIRNKGQRGGKRIVGEREKAIALNAYGRICKICGLPGHDYRNCELRKARDALRLAHQLNKDDNADESSKNELKNAEEILKDIEKKIAAKKTSLAEKLKAARNVDENVQIDF